MKTTLSDYQQQALAFLKKYNIHLTIEESGNQSPPLWAAKGEKYGKRYTIRFFRGLAGKTMTFPYWDSIANKEENASPTEYDILACISGDVHCPESFEDFCAEFGYDEDSRKAEATFHRCNEHGLALRAFFTPEEIKDLSEIN